MVSGEELKGGVANAGAVTRVGRHVLRPSNPYTGSIHLLLRTLRRAGFDGVPLPVGVDPDGRERLEYVEGRVAVPPFPEWVQTDGALASMSRLLRRFHEAADIFDGSSLSWSSEMADPEGGTLVCHNDVCLENVVFRGDDAVALLDFDFAAPGRPIFDLAAFARMCVPVDDEADAARLGWIDADRPSRLRLVADAYGLGTTERGELVGALDAGIKRGGEFVRQRVEAGDPNFLEMWNGFGGESRFRRRMDWWAEHRQKFLEEMEGAS